MTTSGSTVQAREGASAGNRVALLRNDAAERSDAEAPVRRPVVLADATDPAEAFRLIEQERVTHTSLVAALAMRWLDASERERFDLSSLQVLQVGGAKLNPEPARREGWILNCQLQQVFGMAEALLKYTGLDDPAEEVITTQGRPCSPDDEVRIVVTGARVDQRARDREA